MSALCQLLQNQTDIEKYFQHTDNATNAANLEGWDG